MTTVAQRLAKAQKRARVAEAARDEMAQAWRRADKSMRISFDDGAEWSRLPNVLKRILKDVP